MVSWIDYIKGFVLAHGVLIIHITYAQTILIIKVRDLTFCSEWVKKYKFNINEKNDIIKKILTLIGEFSNI